MPSPAEARPPILSDSVVTLRAWSPSGAAFMATAFADEAIRRYNGRLDSDGYPALRLSVADASADIETFAASWRAFGETGRPNGAVFAITDARNSAPLANLTPFIVGLLVVGIGMAWGTNAGYAINPARDFGPRLASFLTGFDNAWRDQYGNLYFWVPILGPLIGGVIGGALYKYCVARFLPADINH